jgi:uncharacterized protein YukE
VALEVKSKNSTTRSIFLWLRSPEEAFIGLSKSGAEPKMISRMQNQIAKSKQQALAAFVRKKAEIDAMLARLQGLSVDHFGYSPDEVTWAHAGTLEHYAELLKRITDQAFNEGEHAD